MKFEEIKVSLEALAAKMAAKGIPQPDAALRISERSYLALTSRYGDRSLGGDNSKLLYGDTPDEMIAAADAFIDALPSPEEQVIATYTRKLADAVDYATEHSLPAAAVAPVQAAIREVNATLLMKGAA